MKLQGLRGIWIQSINILSLKIHADRMPGICRLEIGYILKALLDISGKPGNTGTEHQIHLSIFGIRYHLQELRPVLYIHSGLALIAVNLMKLPVIILIDFEYDDADAVIEKINCLGRDGR